MEPWYKFILYGTYDGFSRSTLGDDNLYLVLENGEKVEVPRCFVKNASDFIEKDKLKLKDVIARIKKLDLGTQKVWLNEILNELGSDYGTLKYKAGYEQGKLEGEWVGRQLKDADKVRQELNKPVVPQFVADWIEKNRGSLFGLNYDSVSSEIYDWVYEEEEEEGNLKKLHLACAIGYTVEKEKRYLVKMRGVNDYGCYLNKGLLSEKYFWESKAEIGGCRTKHTRKQLEDDNFGWVFDCPGIEIEEVTE